MASTMHRPIVRAVAFCVGYANKYCENTSIIVPIFRYPAEFGRFGSMSFSRISSCPRIVSCIVDHCWFDLIIADSFVFDAIFTL